jgi:predicted lipid-binding transport protein (Tim44 family)
VFNWIAFGSGPRSFSGGLSVMGSAGLNGGVSESSGRVFFGIAAVLMDLMVIAMLVKWVRRRVP